MLHLRIPSLLVLLSVLAGSAAGDDGPGLELLKEGDRLADEGQTAEAQVQYKKAFEQLLPEMRKLPYKHEVGQDMTAREALANRIVEEIDREMSPADFHAYESGLKALGFLDQDLDLKKLLAEVYAAEIGAFYDTRTDTMHLIRETDGGGRKPGFLESLLGKKGGFDKDENKAVIAHEMTHALADQHFDLQAMMDSIKNDDDRDMALSALIEGEATLAMVLAQLEDWDGSDLDTLPAEEMGRILRLLGPLLPYFGGAKLRSAPPVVREGMLFPYLEGMVFCASLANRGGWASVDQAYRSPPISTEQVLHPEKYRGDLADPPRDFEFPSLPLPEGWKELGEDVVGELKLSILLQSQRGRTAAKGWDGDRFVVLEGPDGRLGLVWRSVWDDLAEAKEFAEAYVGFQTTKLGTGARRPAVIMEQLERQADGRSFVVARRESDVVVVEGFDDEATRSLVEAAFSACCFEKK